MGVLSYNSLCQGLFSGRYDEGTLFSDLRGRSPYFQAARRSAILALVARAKTMGESYGRSPAQVALRWALDRGPVTSAITGIKHAWQVDENVGACGWALSSEDSALLCDRVADSEGELPERC
jgi:aryl-alcohol dehydrogenase-like predicted oxidoreductase